MPIAIDSRGRIQPAAAALVLCTLVSMPSALRATELQWRQTLRGEAPGDQFAFAMAPAGDVNDDGIPDLLIGANVSDARAAAGGKAYLHLGTANGFAVAPVGCAGRITGEQLGKSVGGGFDLNGDGFDDWLVGAPGIGEDGTLGGCVYVYWGGSVPDGVADLTLEGFTAAGGFGEAIAVLEDFDGDGHADVAVGAPRDGDGKVFLYRGGPDMDAIADVTLTAGSADRRYGATLADLQDQNGDGRSELLIGSPRSSRAATWAGAVLVVFGTDSSNPSADYVLLGENAGDEFGASLLPGVRLNGDAHADLLVGAPAANPMGLVDAGAAYGFFCGPGFDVTADLVFAGVHAGDRFATAMATAFDWNDDGFEDFAIGAPFADTALQDAGTCSVFLGGAITDGAAAAVINGVVSQQQFASSLTGVGVANQAGFLVMGDSYLDAGRAQLYGTVGAPTDAGPSTPSAARLLRPWPNPFNPQVRSSLQLTTPGSWRVQVVDSRGRVIAVLVDAALEPGTHDLRWDGRGRDGSLAASGVYWIRARGPSQQQTAKITLVR